MEVNRTEKGDIVDLWASDTQIAVLTEGKVELLHLSQRFFHTSKLWIVPPNYQFLVLSPYFLVLYTSNTVLLYSISALYDLHYRKTVLLILLAISSLLSGQPFGYSSAAQLISICSTLIPTSRTQFSILSLVQNLTTTL